MAKKKAKKKNIAGKAKKRAAVKKVAKRKAAKKATGKAVAKNKSGKMNLAPRSGAKTVRVKKRPQEKRIRSKAQIVDGVEIERPGLGAKYAGQSGDLQGLSTVTGADSESVAELLEEGQSYEAEVVHGVENAKDADQGEVRTHEVPEDDVPEEYRKRDLLG